MKFWLPSLARLVVVGSLALIGAAVGGAATGWAIASIGFLALVIVQLRYLASLQRWLRAPNVEEIPDGWGAWSDVFGELYRAHRREEKSRKQIGLALDRFQQAAQALPDAVILLDADDRIEWANAMAESQFGIELARDRGQAMIIVRTSSAHVARHDGLADNPNVALHWPETINSSALSHQIVPHRTCRRRTICIKICPKWASGSCKWSICKLGCPQRQYSPVGRAAKWYDPLVVDSL